MKTEPQGYRPRAVTAVVVAVAILCAVMAAIGWAQFWQIRQATDNVTISACDPADFVDGICQGPTPDPDGPTNGGVVLTPDLTIPVSGVVCTEDKAAYAVTVAWVAVESGASFPVLSTPITWEQGCQAPYTIEWAAPPQIYALASQAEPGADLGLFRIVGRAEPVNALKYRPVQWDSVKTFRILAPPAPNDLQDP